MSSMFRPNRDKISRRAFIGFSIFDLFHLIFPITLLVLTYVEKPIDSMEAAECVVEIVFAMILIAFTVTLAHHNKDRNTFHALYTFCWIVATASLFVPLAFDIPEIIVGEWSVGRVALALSFDLASMVMAFVAFLLNVIILMKWNASGTWVHLIRASMILVLICATIEFASEFTFNFTPAQMTLHCLKDLAPIPAAILGLTLCHNKHFYA